MKKIAIVTVALCMVLSIIVGGVAFAAAQKLDLRENPPPKNVPAAHESVAGFVVLNNDNETDEVVVVVSLKEGAPNRTYGIFLEEYEEAGGWKYWDYLGDLTTNRNGKGNFDSRIPRSSLWGPGDTHYLQIVVSYPWGTWGTGSFGTDIAAVTIE